MLTDYDIHRTAQAVVELLLDDDRFISRMQKIAPKRAGHMLNSKQAAAMLGISAYTIREIAPMIGGIKKGSDRYQHWCFEEDGLKERYMSYCNQK